jgi:hypothetical protein
MPVLVAEPFERRGVLFVRRCNLPALSAYYLVRFARKSPDPNRGPAVELVFTGANRAPHGRVQQLQRLMAAQKPSDDALRGLRAFFGDTEARVGVGFDMSIDDPEVTSMAAAAKLSAFLEYLEPLVAQLK